MQVVVGQPGLIDQIVAGPLVGGDGAIAPGHDDLDCPVVVEVGDDGGRVDPPVVMHVVFDTGEEVAVSAPYGDVVEGGDDLPRSVSVEVVDGRAREPPRVADAEVSDEGRLAHVSGAAHIVARRWVSIAVPVAVSIPVSIAIAIAVTIAVCLAAIIAARARRKSHGTCENDSKQNGPRISIHVGPLSRDRDLTIPRCSESALYKIDEQRIGMESHASR